MAAAARIAGLEVTVVDSAPQPLHAVLGDRLGQVFAGLHREHGVDLQLNNGVGSVDREPSGRAMVTLSDGTVIAPDRVVIGVGAAPADDLATAAGLTTGNGIWVDARLRASDPAVFAAGDVAAQDHPVLRTRLRVEHWDTAAAQGRAAARVMLGGDDPYDRLPYFFTDQYDLGMEYVGHVPPGQSSPRSSSVVTRPLACSPRSGSTALGCSPGCTSTTGTPPRTSGGWSARDVDVRALRDQSVSLGSLDVSHDTVR